MKKLNKGLDAIFGKDFQETIDSIENNFTNNTNANELVEIPINKIIPNPFNPRKTFDDEKIKELAVSIKEQGLLTPIIVKKAEAGNYYIVAGERRFRATKSLGLPSIKAIVVDLDDKKMFELAIIENIQRENLSSFEEALAYDSLIKKHNYTHEDLSTKLGKSRSYITNLLRVLKLDAEILNFLSTNQLTFGHIKPLITLETNIAKEIARVAIKHKMSVRDVEKLAKEESSTKKNYDKKDNESFEYVQDLIRTKINTKVKVTNKQIVIDYNGTSNLNDILKKLGVIK